MEQPQQTAKDKEILLDPEDDSANSPGYDLSLLQLIDLKTNKKVKPKAKIQKTPVASIRPGDWVCLICSNLNFSFRNECNRCQMQTKRRNYLESLQLFSDNRKMETERIPFKDLTNQNLPVNFSEFPEFHKKSKSSSLADLCLDLNLIPPHGFETYSQGSLDSIGMDSDNCTNSGFESVILLTPPKISKKESQETDFLPYKSPKKLPSVSPILKNMLKEESHKRKSSAFQDNYCLEKALNFVSEALCYEEYELKDHYNLGGSEDETTTSANTGRKFSTDEQEEAEETEPDTFTENILQDFQLSFIDDYPKEENLKGNSKNLSKTEVPVLCEKKSCEENSKKAKKERKSDWICINCGNLNYSFRKYCNRCQIIR